MNPFYAKLAGDGEEIKQRCLADVGGENARDYFGMISGDLFTDIVCFSDIHAHMNLVVTILQDVGIIRVVGDKIQWTAPPEQRWAIVVNGDMVDGKRGLSGTKRSEFMGEERLILIFLNAVDLLARQHKSRLFKLVGNHELMNMLGQFSHVTPMGVESFGSERKREEAFQFGGEMNAQLRACGSYAILKIGDLVFVHAGVMPELIEQVRTLQKQEAGTQKKLHSLDFISLSNQVHHQMMRTPKTEWDTLDPWWKLLFVQPNSLLWTRKFSDIAQPSETPDSKLRGVFRALGATEAESQRMTMIVGHTPQVYRCFAELTNQGYKTHCPFTGYTLRRKVFENDHIQAFGGPFVKDTDTFHDITFACLSETKIPGLCFLDTAQSRAFDSHNDSKQDRTGQTLIHARRPSALHIRLPSRSLGLSSQPIFEVIRSRTSIE